MRSTLSTYTDIDYKRTCTMRKLHPFIYMQPSSVIKLHSNLRRICIYTHTHTHTYLWIRRTYLYRHTHTHTQIYIYFLSIIQQHTIFRGTYTHTHTHTYIHAHTHTYKHTHKYHSWRRSDWKYMDFQILRFTVNSFERWGLRLLTWNPMWNFGDPRENIWTV